MSKKPIGKGNKQTGGGSLRRLRESEVGGEPMLDQSQLAKNGAAADPDPALISTPIEPAFDERPLEASAADAAAETRIEAADLVGLGSGAEMTLPLLGEELQIEKRLIVKDRIVVARRTLEKEQWIDEILRREDIEVERVTIGREIDEVPAIQQDEELIVVPIVEEVLVTHRQLVLKEEVRVQRVQQKIQHREIVTVREQEGVVARLAPEVAQPPAKTPISFLQLFVGSGFDQLTQAHAIFRSTNAWLARAIDQDRRSMEALQSKFLEVSTLPFTAGLHVFRAFGGLSGGDAGPVPPDRG